MNIVDKIGPVIYNKHAWSDPAQRPLIKASLTFLFWINSSLIFVALFFNLAWQWNDGFNAAIFCIFTYNMALVVAKFAKEIKSVFIYVLYVVILNLFVLSYSDGGLFNSTFSLYYFLLIPIATSLGRHFLLRYIIILISWFLIWLILETTEIVHFPNTLPPKFDRSLLIVNFVIFFILLLVVTFTRLMEVESNEKYSLKTLSQKYEEELEKAVNKNVLEAITNTEEKERKRVARDLHDSVGPLLSSVKLSMSAMNMASEEDRKKMMDTSLEIINEAIRDVRQISHNMMPIPIQEKGLYFAVAQLLKRFDIPGSLQTHIHHPDQSTNLNSASSAILYRAIEELINNTVKHASAQNIYLEFTEKDGLLNVSYNDDGKGFDINSIQSKTKGLGLSNVKDRILTLNGSINFNGSNGFSADIVIPV